MSGSESEGSGSPGGGWQYGTPRFVPGVCIWGIGWAHVEKYDGDCR